MITQKHNMANNEKSKTPNIKMQVDFLIDALRKRDEDLKMKDIFFSMVLHDLLSPISGIVSMSDLYSENEIVDMDDLKNCLTIVNSSSKRIHELLTSLYEWNQAKSFATPFNIENLNIKGLIEHNLQLLSLNIYQKEIKVELSVPENLYIKAEKNSANSIIRNLVTNAIKFSHKKGVVEISSYIYHDNSEYLTLCVKDRGIGMKQVYAESLFNSDKLISQNGTSNEKGLGIGLMLCKDLVARNGGKIWVTSTEHLGSTFYVLFKKSIEN